MLWQASNCIITCTSVRLGTRSVVCNGGAEDREDSEDSDFTVGSRQLAGEAQAGWGLHATCSNNIALLELFRKQERH